MDRIRKALDLARTERAHVLDSARLEQVAPAEIRDEPASKPRQSVILYTQTQVFSPTSDTLERNRVLPANSTAAAAAAFRMLRTQVLQRMNARGWRTLAIFSPTANDGKTTTALNLAVSMATDHSHTVLLVDLDFRRPTLAKCLELEPPRGADDALSGAAPVEACLYHPDGFDRLVIMPARGPLANSSEILAGPRSREIVAELRGRYPERIVVYDLPPVLTADDALAFAPLVDCGLIVAAEGKTRRRDLVRTMELLRDVPIVGIVLNRAADTPPGY